MIRISSSEFDVAVIEAFCEFTGRDEAGEAAVGGYLGDNALIRLMEVACALDSVVVGEHHVTAVGQVPADTVAQIATSMRRR